jgi:hypothetical protein
MVAGMNCAASPVWGERKGLSWGEQRLGDRAGGTSNSVADVGYQHLTETGLQLAGLSCVDCCAKNNATLKGRLGYSNKAARYLLARPEKSLLLIARPLVPLYLRSSGSVLTPDMMQLS